MALNYDPSLDARFAQALSITRESHQPIWVELVSTLLGEHRRDQAPWEQLYTLGICRTAADDPLPPLEDLDEGTTCDLCQARYDTFTAYLAHRRGHGER